MIGKYHIEEIGHWEAANFLASHHYLSQLGNGFIATFILGLYNEKDQLCGVCCFNGISSPETLVGAFGLPRDSDQTGFVELVRLAMDDDKKERNLTSWFVARSIKMMRIKLKPRALISYADSRFHNGYIYQATNFAYCGMTSPKKDFVVNGKIRQRGKTKGVEGGVWKDRPRKHRYIIVFDKTLQVKWVRKLYPKGVNDCMKIEKPKVEYPTLFD